VLEARYVGCENTDMTSYVGNTDTLHLQLHTAQQALEAKYVGCENTDIASYIGITDTLHLQLHAAQQALEAEKEAHVSGMNSQKSAF